MNVAYPWDLTDHDKHWKMRIRITFWNVLFVSLVIYLYPFAEWPGYKGGEVEEADERKEEQGQEDPWCKEGKGTDYLGVCTH